MSKPEDIPQDVWDAALSAMHPATREAYDISPFAMVQHLGIARAIFAERERHRQAAIWLKNKINAANQERGKFKQAAHKAEQRERQLSSELSRWVARAKAAEAELASLGKVNAAHKISAEA